MLQTKTIVLVALAALALCLHSPVCGEESDPPKDRPNYLIITANDFASAAKEWADYRAAQGRKVQVMKVGDIATNWGHEFASVTDIRNSIKGAAGPTISDAFQVLLIGDAPKDSDKYDPKVELPWFVTTYKDEQGTLIAGDNYYADLMKDDEVPEIAVGRIPARTIEEVRLALEKVKAYEGAKYGEWVKRLTFFAGEGHYGPMIDSMIEAAFTQFVDEHVDNAYDVRMTYANLDSPYAWIPSKFSEKVIDEANMGSLLLTYIGHGAWDHLDQFVVKVGDKTTTYPILKADDVSKFSIKDGQLPVMLIIACDTGWLDAKPEKRCLAERVLFADNAPVAVIASSRNSHPYSNMIVQKGIVQGIANKKLATLGDAFAYMKRELILADEPDRAELESMAALLMPKKKERDAKNTAHLHLYNLIGDPGLKLKHPNVTIEASCAVDSMEINAPGKTVVKVKFGPGLDYEPPNDKRIQLIERYLALRRSSLKDGQKPVDLTALIGEDAEKKKTAEDVVASNHKLANDKFGYRLSVDSVTATKDHALKSFEIMAYADNTLAPGDYLVKIFALDAKGEHCGFASIPLKVEKKKE
ncbi:MAG: hypothetical protein IT462_08870 [Planctomycetes bacterium]|nr:hypothetical protein [Planctomycetota bacterium]